MSRLRLARQFPTSRLIDLDPTHGCPTNMIVESRPDRQKEKMDGMGMEGYPKTTGGEG